MTAANKNTLALGLMSGTSADGLTICLFDVKAKKVIHYKNYPYTKDLQNKILKAPSADIPKLSALNFELGRLYAAKAESFIKEFKINTKKIAAVGSHGQTVYHCPEGKIPNTLQIGEASFLALKTGLITVCDFRPADIAAGGTGAPLIPFFDDYLYKTRPPLILLNIGGISNAAIAGKGIKPFGFDIGPGNVMIDAAMQILTKGKQPYDKNGILAAKYKPDTQKALSLLKLFVGKKPPVSLDRNAFAEPFVKKHFPALEERDISTITYLTALIIAQSIKKFILSKHKVKMIAVNGGGFFNKTLIKNLMLLIPGLKICSIEVLGIPPMAKEAAAFALFAYNTLNGKVSNCKAATGAKKEVVLGKIILP